MASPSKHAISRSPLALASSEHTQVALALLHMSSAEALGTGEIQELLWHE